MDIQRLRNLTTGRLHTDVGFIYQDIEYLTGEKGVMTHMLPNAMRALEPWLREKLSDRRLWDGEYDPSHIGEIDIEPKTACHKAVVCSPECLIVLIGADGQEAGR
jgi:hypothetical protein